MNNNITIVTGLWDLGRGNLSGWAKRDFEQYKSKFFDLLNVDVQMCIWIPEDLEEEVKNIRGDKPTKIFIKNIEDFKSWNPFYNKIQEIRTDSNWFNFAGWLAESPQATLEFYNPMMFTKMFMLNDSAIVNPFKSDYFFWIDGGISSTVDKGYFQKDKVFDNLENYVSVNSNKFVFLSYPYDANQEIHGFERTAMAKYCQTDFVDYVCRGGFFGGHKDNINEVNSLYYGIMETTLNDGYMGADECLFTILSYKYKDLINRFEISGNGLVWPFFENLKTFDNKNYEQIKKVTRKNIALYILTFNSPNQLQTLIDSMLEYDEDFVYKPQLILLDNSTDLSTQPKYSEICEKYDIIHIKKDNLGICGGRQFIAEHADENEFDFYFFFEDDMFFYPKKGEVCKNGFNRWVDKLYSRSLNIISNNSFDFLKLSFTEFFGDNKTQWSWYNVPQSVREELWPEKPKLPTQGLDPNAPKTKFNNIYSIDNLAYIDGEIYYSNWPQVVSREGNKKMFLETKWVRPYEQTWMSFMYQETKKGNIKPAILLLTPTEHNRFDHYERELRKES